MVTGISAAYIPVAEAVYPPGGRPRDPAQVRARFFVIAIVVCLAAAAGITALAVADSAKRRETTATNLKLRADAFTQQHLTGPEGLASARRFGHLALFQEPAKHVTAKPPVHKTDVRLKILAVDARPLDVVLPNADRPQLVGAGYQQIDRGSTALPDGRAIDTAIAMAASTRSAEDSKQVTLVHWAADTRGGTLRVLPIDFSNRDDVGIVFSAIDARIEDQEIAFALGDPVTGDGTYISDWAVIPPAS